MSSPHWPGTVLLQCMVRPCKVDMAELVHKVKAQHEKYLSKVQRHVGVEASGFFLPESMTTPTFAHHGSHPSMLKSVPLHCLGVRAEAKPYSRRIEQ
jgi:hypothetical protein